MSGNCCGPSAACQADPKRVGLFAGQHRLDRLLLVRNDDNEDVRHHDGADQRADLGESAAAAEDMREAVGQADQKDVADQRQGDFVFAQGRPA